MNKELQDLAWKCIPKEAGSNIKQNYAASLHIKETGYAGALEDAFGKHNLNSDTEPEEMLMVERRIVQEMYESFGEIIRWANDGPKGYKDKVRGEAVRTALSRLFGDKCLPDKEVTDDPAEITDTLDFLAERDAEICNEQPKSSVQVEPKFKVGDKVRKTSWDNDTTISKVEWHGTWGTFVYQFKEQEYGFNCHKENDLTLVTKRAKDPDFSIGDKVQLKFDWCRLPKETSLTIKDIPTIDRDNTFMYSFEETDEYIRETMLEPCTEPEKGNNEGKSGNNSEIPNQTKDNMEEKELNLSELLKGCEGEEFYSPTFGDVRLGIIDKDYIGVVSDEDPASYKIFANGTYTKNGKICLYPSRALYEKYPLDAKKAWMEWKEARKPKRWRAEKGEEYWFLSSLYRPMYSYDEYGCDEDWLYESGNYFRTKEEAQQAAEVVKEALQKFHEKNDENRLWKEQHKNLEMQP